MDAEKHGLPAYTAVATSPTPSLYSPQPFKGGSPRRRRTIRLALLACVAFIVYAQWRQIPGSQDAFKAASDHATINSHGLSMAKLQQDLSMCTKLLTKAQEPKGLGRERSERYLDGHKPTLIRNATIWVGEPAPGTSTADARAGKGWSWVPEVDIYMEFGLIKSVEKTGKLSLSSLAKDTLVYDAGGRQVTAGIIDMHSHMGVDARPELWGTSDTNEVSSPITPYVRSKDGFQPADHQIQVIKSGGVTTSLILPGSANNMGGEAYVVKHAVGKPDGREEISFQDMLADPSESLRYMKMACGENAKRVYGKFGEHGPTSRLGESWEFRHALEQAAKLVARQDDWCGEAGVVGVEGMNGYLPMELEWESLSAVLRGQVFVNTHCYTVPDLEAFVDHTNEFNFSVRAFHHAHQTYLVPEILKRAWGDRPPASALFATNMYYKTESYTGSEYAGKILYENGLVPIYVSDNPVLNAQHVLVEAAKAYKFGLPYHAALASVTTEPADHLGLGQRIGKLKPGFDADVVVWDSDPLNSHGTPVQVWIDGTAQYEDPVVIPKAASGPIVPDLSLNNTRENRHEVEADIVLTGLAANLIEANEAGTYKRPVSLVISQGAIKCVGKCTEDVSASEKRGVKIINLRNGYLTRSYTALGSTIGLNAIDSEKATEDGKVSTEVFTRAVDGLAFETKKLRVAHDFGITSAISAPKLGSEGARHGVSVAFSTGASSVLEKGAILVSDVAVHYSLLDAAKTDKLPSISALVGALRQKLRKAALATKEEVKKTIEANPYSEESYLLKVIGAEVPLVITVHSADTIATLLTLKEEISALSPSTSYLPLVILGGAEAHLLASQLAAANTSVILAPVQSYSYRWEQRRSLTGAPLTNGTSVDVLVSSGVKTAIGLEEDWLIRDLSLLASRAYHNSGGKISVEMALGLISVNLGEMMMLKEKEEDWRERFVVHEGHPLDIGSRIVAVGGGLGKVTVFE